MITFPDSNISDNPAQLLLYFREDSRPEVLGTRLSNEAEFRRALRAPVKDLFEGGEDGSFERQRSWTRRSWNVNFR